MQVIIADVSEDGNCPGLESFLELRQPNVRMFYRFALRESNPAQAEQRKQSAACICSARQACFISGVSPGRFSKWALSLECLDSAALSPETHMR